MAEQKTRFYRSKVFFIPLLVILVLGIFLCGLYYFRTPVLMSLFSTKSYPVVVVSGTWEEMGYQVGSRPEFAKGIHRTALFLKRPFPPEKAAYYFDRVKHLIPQSILGQMKGLARGEVKALGISSGEAWKDVLIWNFFVTSTYMKERKGCTDFSVTSKDGSFLAHNTDVNYLYALGGSIIIFKPNPGMGYSFVSFYQPGYTGVALGENSAGLAVVFNAAYPSKRNYGLPPEMFVRKVMQECGSLEEAVEAFRSFLKKGGRFAHNGAIFTFMDFKARKMARVEVTPDRVEVDYGVTEGDKHFVVATNHYRLMPERNDREDFNTSSYARYERCRMLLKMESDLSMKGIMKILTDHDGKNPGTDHTICRHKNLNVGTNSSLFFDDKFVLYYILGNPCQYWKDPSVLQVVRWKER